MMPEGGKAQACRACGLLDAPLFRPCGCALPIHPECLLRSLKTLSGKKGKRCPECNETLSFGSAPADKDTRGLLLAAKEMLFGRLRSRAHQLAVRLAKMVWHVLVLPILIGSLMAWTWQGQLPMHALLGIRTGHRSEILAVSAFLHGLVATVFVLAVFRAGGHLQRIMEDRARRRARTRSQLPVKEGNGWLAAVSPREYRAYLRRRELHRERQERATLSGLAAPLDDDAIESMCDPTDANDTESLYSVATTALGVHVGSIASESNPTAALSQGKSWGGPAGAGARERLVGQQPASGLPVSIREPFRCKICTRKTCIDREHVVSASALATAVVHPPSPTSPEEPAPPNRTEIGKGNGGAGTWGVTVKVAMVHFALSMLIIAIPICLGRLILDNFDRCLAEVLRVSGLTVTYFAPSINLQVKPPGIRLEQVALGRLSRPLAELLIGELATVTVLLGVKGRIRREGSTIKGFLEHYLGTMGNFAKLALEFALVPSMVGSLAFRQAPGSPGEWLESLAKGWVLLDLAKGSLLPWSAGLLRSGLLHWTVSWGVPDRSLENLVAILTADSFSAGRLLLHAKFTIPMALLCGVAGRMVGATGTRAPWYLWMTLVWTDNLCPLFNFFLSLLVDRARIEGLPRRLAARLRLSSIVFGGRHPDEEDFTQGGRYVFAPSQPGKRYQRERLETMLAQPVEPVDIALMPETDANFRFKGFTAVYQPDYWQCRMAVFVGMIGTLAVALAAVLARLPHMICPASLREGALKGQDDVVWIIGYLVLCGLVRLTRALWQHRAKAFRAIWATGAAMTSVFLLSTVHPLLVGHILECLRQTTAILERIHGEGTPVIYSPSLLTLWKTGIGPSIALCLVGNRAGGQTGLGPGLLPDTLGLTKRLLVWSLVPPVISIVMFPTASWFAHRLSYPIALFAGLAGTVLRRLLHY